MSHLRLAITCPDCPLFTLPERERELADIQSSWGETPRELATESLRGGATPNDVIVDLGYEFRTTSDFAVALVGCVARQVIIKNCPFRDID